MDTLSSSDQSIYHHIVRIIPLSAFLVLSACATHHNMPPEQGYSTPPSNVTKTVVWDYREFGVPVATATTGLLAGRSKIAKTLMQDAKLLMQLGYDCQWFSVQNRHQQIEHWLVVVGFNSRQQARKSLSGLLDSGLWNKPIPLIAMPLTDPSQRVAGRGVSP